MSRYISSHSIIKSTLRFRVGSFVTSHCLVPPSVSLDPQASQSNRHRSLKSLLVTFYALIVRLEHLVPTLLHLGARGSALGQMKLYRSPITNTDYFRISFVQILSLLKAWNLKQSVLTVCTCVENRLLNLTRLSLPDRMRLSFCFPLKLSVKLLRPLTC